MNQSILLPKIGFSWRRLFALCQKETYQIIRDPSSWLIAIIMPLMLLFIFAYGINLDSTKLRIGIVVQQENRQVRDFISTYIASPFIDATVATHKEYLVQQMQEGKIRGLIILPSNFAEKMTAGQTSPIQVITDGSEPNTANFVQAYAQGLWQTWLTQQAQDHGVTSPIPIDIKERFWFNSSASSQHFIIPGAITIIMTVLGAILTSLVIAREWERGTMEALLSTQITRSELLISKLLPYYILGIIAMLICMVISVIVFQIPYRGSLFLLFIMTSLFLAAILGMGLMISTLTRNQFDAAQIALNAGFLPAIMLSGFIFEIKSMPIIIQIITYFVSARYFVNTLQTLFLTGNVAYLLIINAVFLIAMAIIFIGITAAKTRLRLD